MLDKLINGCMLVYWVVLALPGLVEQAEHERLKEKGIVG